MKHPHTQELFVAGVFTLVLVLMLNPFGFFMPDKLVSIMLGGILVLFGLYATFVLKESPQDEREHLHRFLANRLAYLLGTTALVLGIVWQGITLRHVDPWLLVVLGTMVIAKVASLFYSDKNR